MLTRTFLTLLTIAVEPSIVSQETLIAGYERKVNWRSGCV
jgi:hypothetical protein